MHITVVTATYSRRWNLLKQTLRAALEFGADEAIVVDNASEEEIGPLAADAFHGKVRTIKQDSNQGSSAYCAGLSAALEANAEFVLLLDDDNRVEPETIATLRRTWQELSVSTPADNLCVVAFRPDHMPHILEGRPVDILHSSPNAFFGFHVKDIPRKIWKWMPRPKRTAARNDPNYAERLYYQATAPYGGMFFHRSVLQRHGLPDARYVLYHDDLEFSYRISSSGGAVVVDPRARIEDLERSWGSGSEEKTTFGKIVDLGSDRQIYYTARNLAYFESHRRTASWIRQVNRAVWFFIVWGVARLHNRRARFALIHRAIRDGEKSVLGINPAFPLA